MHKKTFIQQMIEKITNEKDLWWKIELKLIENFQYASKKLLEKKLIDQNACDKYFRSS